MLGKLLKAAAHVAIAPVAVVADVVSAPARSMSYERSFDEPFFNATGKTLGAALKNIEEACE